MTTRVGDRVYTTLLDRVKAFLKNFFIILYEGLLLLLLLLLDDKPFFVCLDQRNLGSFFCFSCLIISP